MRLFKRENGVWYIEAGRGQWRSLKTKDETRARKDFENLKRETLRGNLFLLDKKVFTFYQAVPG